MTGMFCGMVAFALHNFVTFSCQLPSAGSLFFIFGGILVFRCGKIDIVTIPESLTKKWTVAVLVALLICVVPVLILLSECAGEYYWRQAVIDEGKGNFQGALQNYDDAIRVIGNYPELFLNKGDFLFRQKSYGPALDCFKRSVAFVPDIETHYKIALCSLELNLVEEGRFYLDLALRENPRHKRALLLRERFFGRANN
jgi:tetratricopeptide (TPR) repeat protein